MSQSNDEPVNQVSRTIKSSMTRRWSEAQSSVSSFFRDLELRTEERDKDYYLKRKRRARRAGIDFDAYDHTPLATPKGLHLVDRHTIVQHDILRVADGMCSVLTQLAHAVHGDKLWRETTIEFGNVAIDVGGQFSSTSISDRVRCLWSFVPAALALAELENRTDKKEKREELA
jgi:hypothetical protein